jgi:hypothetical protein
MQVVGDVSGYVCWVLIEFANIILCVDGYLLVSTVRLLIIYIVILSCQCADNLC